ncbi:hypothetical protein OG422_14735 [Streptomyces sp. NBC_01525]|uniref:hypothetical protein n=1 Tax=Streptomyces sp. NBC_01525 TaxID=2903893 RepID=UPI00386FDC6F
MFSRRVWRGALASIFSFTVLSGCSLIPGSGDAAYPTVDKALRRVDSVLDDTLTGIRPRVRWRDGPAHMSERRNSFTNDANGEMDVSRQRHLRTQVSQGKKKELLKIVSRRWEEKGFEAKEQNNGRPSLLSEASDGCIAKIDVGGSGDVYISVGVSAVSSGPSGDIAGEEGDSFPKAPSGASDYTPDLRDPYWSN